MSEKLRIFPRSDLLKSWYFFLVAALSWKYFIVWLGLKKRLLQTTAQTKKMTVSFRYPSRFSCFSVMFVSEIASKPLRRTNDRAELSDTKTLTFKAFHFFLLEIKYPSFCQIQPAFKTNNYYLYAKSRVTPFMYFRYLAKCIWYPSTL